MSTSEFEESDYSGDPSSWSKDQMTTWLRKHNFDVPEKSSQLREAVLREQEKLWKSLKIRRLVDVDGLVVSRLRRWFHTPAESETDNPAMNLMYGLGVARSSGPLEGHFSQMFSLEERFKFLSTALPCGENVYLDFRTDLLTCVKQLSQKVVVHIYEATDKEKGVIVRPLDIRMSFLPHDNDRFEDQDKAKGTGGVGKKNEGDADADGEGETGKGDEGKSMRTLRYKAGGSLPEGMRVVVLKGEGHGEIEEGEIGGKVGVVRSPCIVSSSSSSGPMTGWKIDIEKERGAEGEGVVTTVDVPKHRLALLRLVEGKEKEEPGKESEGWVVLCGLKSRPELNGLCGFIRKGSWISDKKRVRVCVTLQPASASPAAEGGITWGFPEAHAFSQETGEAECIAVKPENILPVRDPMLLVVCAYMLTTKADLRKASTMRVFQSMLGGEKVQKDHAFGKTKCTRPELDRFVSFLQEASEEGSQQKGTRGICVEEGVRREWMQALGLPARGDSKVQLSVLTPVEAPEGSWKSAEKELKKQEECRTCGKQNVTFQKCGGCRAVAYCSRECQRADWRARHKQECRAEQQVTKSSGSTAAEGDGESASSSSSSSSSAETVGQALRLPIVPEMPSRAADRHMISFTTGRIGSMGTRAVPSNRYGDKRFLVKLQRPTDGASGETNMYVYDQARSLELFYYKEKYPEEFRVLENVMNRKGTGMGPGWPNVRLYLWAKRVGRELEVDLQDVPKEQRREVVGW